MKAITFCQLKIKLSVVTVLTVFMLLLCSKCQRIQSTGNEYRGKNDYKAKQILLMRSRRRNNFDYSYLSIQILHCKLHALAGCDGERREDEEIGFLLYSTSRRDWLLGNRDENENGFKWV